MRAAPLVLALSYAVFVIPGRNVGTPGQIAMLASGYAAAISGVAGLFGGVVLLVRLTRARRRGEATSGAALVRDLLMRRWRADRCLSLWQPLAAFVVLMTAFTLFKQTVLPAAGFGTGPSIAAADRALFGIDPWRITHALFPSPWATQAFDLAYHMWFAPMTLGLVLCAAARPGSVLASRYLLAYALLWIVQGSLLAYWLPAAGPCFFASFQTETNRFAELTALLAKQNAALRAAGAPGLAALTYQDYLLRLFSGHSVALGGGISAMPSLHNALAVLFVCAGRHVSRRLGTGLAIYAAVIWLGSIHLGWHYALDGLVALAATLATWKLTGVLCHLLRERTVPDMAEPIIARIRIS